MQKSRRRKKSKKWYSAKLLVTAIILVMVVIIAGIIYFTTTFNAPKKPAREYFEITNIKAIAQSIQSGVKIFMISFNLTAVEGDAHNVYISIDGLKTQEGQGVLIIGDIKKGESYTVQNVQLVGYVTRLEGLGYPFEIRVYSSETDSNNPEIPVYIPHENVSIVG